MDLCVQLCTYLVTFDDVKLYFLAIADGSQIFLRVVLHDGCLVNEHIFFGVIPVGEGERTGTRKARLGSTANIKMGWTSRGKSLSNGHGKVQSKDQGNEISKKD